MDVVTATSPVCSWTGEWKRLSMGPYWKYLVKALICHSHSYRVPDVSCISDWLNWQCYCLLNCWVWNNPPPPTVCRDSEISDSDLKRLWTRLCLVLTSVKVSLFGLVCVYSFLQLALSGISKNCSSSHIPKGSAFPKTRCCPLAEPNCIGKRIPFACTLYMWRHKSGKCLDLFL